MVFTSLPDMSEVVEVLGSRFEDWEQFFMKAWAVAMWSWDARTGSSSCRLQAGEGLLIV